MVSRLARWLDLTLRQRNGLLRAAGHAAAFPERRLDAAARAPVRAVIDRMLAAHGLAAPHLALEGVPRSSRPTVTTVRARRRRGSSR